MYFFYLLFCSHKGKNFGFNKYKTRILSASKTMYPIPTSLLPQKHKWSLLNQMNSIVRHPTGATQMFQSRFQVGYGQYLLLVLSWPCIAIMTTKINIDRPTVCNFTHGSVLSFIPTLNTSELVSVLTLAKLQNPC